MTDQTNRTPLEAAIDAEPPSIVVQEGPDNGKPVVVYTASSEEDGEIVRGLLESEGIEVILTTAGSPIYGEVFSIGEGQAGEILVAPSDVKRAKDILAAESGI